MYINITNTTLSSPTFFLCLPNGQIIENISADIYQPKLNIKFGNISELSFSVPYQIENHHELIDNPYIFLLKNRYLIKMIYQNHTEFFTIDTPSSKMTDDSDVKNIVCYLLPYLLRDKLIRSFVTTTSITATEAMVQTLSTSEWNVDHVSSQFDLLYRSFDVTSCTALDMLFQIAETYQGVLQFDTVNRTVSMYDTSELNINRGIIFDYGKYLDKLDYAIDPEFCTRLYLTGKDGSVINSVNPCGTGYIENFYYFLDGFERSEDKTTVLVHSSYMSDNLCNAILNYNELIATQTPTFNDYITSLGLLQGDLLVLQSELTDLNSELIIIDNSLEMAATSGQSTTQLIIDKAAKELEITNKNTAIVAKNLEITAVETNISNLGTLLSMESNFSSEELTELSRFIIEKETSNEYISNPSDLLAWGQKEILKIVVPPMNLKIDSVNFFQCLDPECITDKAKINLNGGDVITVKYSTFDLNAEAIITEIDLDFESDTISFTVSSCKDMKTDKDKYLAILNKSMSTSTTMDYNKSKFNDIEATKNDVNILLTGIQDATTRSIVGGVNNSVIIDGRGISIIDPSDNNNIVRLNHSHIALSTSGGIDFKNAITPQGIIGEKIIGRILLGSALSITTGNGDFSVDSENGVVINGAALTITNKLPDSQISSATIWNNSLQKSTAYNGVVISSENGIVITKYNTSNVKLADLTLNATTGIKIRKTTDDGVTWTDKFYINTSGDLIFTGLMTGGQIQIGSGSSVFCANTAGIYLGSTTYSSAPARISPSGYAYFSNADISGTIRASSLYVGGTNILTELNQINGSYIQGSTITNLNAGNITTGTLSANRIDTTNLYAERIYQPGNSSNFLAIYNASWGSSLNFMKNGSSELFTIADQGDNTVAMFLGGSYLLRSPIGGDNSVTVHGRWDFDSATVENLNAVAKFG